MSNFNPSKQTYRKPKGNVKNSTQRIILFNKPFDVLTQFTDQKGRKTLKDYINIPDVYAAGRLDRDSEGLLLLTNDGKLQHQLANPKQKTIKSYWVQVDGDIAPNALESLRKGVQLKDGWTSPAKVEKITEPDIWRRDPPVRYRASIPTSWINISITEGKNRQVRRMTAAVGYPTLRLIRHKIGEWSVEGIALGEYLLIK